MMIFFSQTGAIPLALALMPGSMNDAIAPTAADEEMQEFWRII